MKLNLYAKKTTFYPFLSSCFILFSSYFPPLPSSPCLPSSPLHSIVSFGAPVSNEYRLVVEGQLPISLQTSQVITGENFPIIISIMLCWSTCDQYRVVLINLWSPSCCDQPVIRIVLCWSTCDHHRVVLINLWSPSCCDQLVITIVLCWSTCDHHRVVINLWSESCCVDQLVITIVLCWLAYDHYHV